jgi:hypothetical protein
MEIYGTMKLVQVLNYLYYRGITMWEYKTETLNTIFYSASKLRSKYDEILNKNAKEGWELDKYDSSDFGGSLKTFIFKREKK